MKIGTAPPSDHELSQVKHHFIHNKSIFDNYTVYDFSIDAKSCIDKSIFYELEIKYDETF